MAGGLGLPTAMTTAGLELGSSHLPSLTACCYSPDGGEVLLRRFRIHITRVRCFAAPIF
jgi:hypothetical protein